METNIYQKPDMRAMKLLSGTVVCTSAGGTNEGFNRMETKDYVWI